VDSLLNYLYDDIYYIDYKCISCYRLDDIATMATSDHNHIQNLFLVY
jgi:hypothetical protein